MSHFSLRTIALFGLFLLFSHSLGAQATNPTPQNLPYSQNFNSFTGSAPVWPAGWAGWIISNVSAGTFLTAAPTGDAVLNVGTAASTSLATYDFNGKAGVLNTASGTPAIALAINTSGLAQITVSYDVMTIREPAARLNSIALQYRVGNTGTFTTLGGTEYANLGSPTTTAGTNPVNAAQRTIILPSNCNNQPEVQLRWHNRDSAGSGGRPSFAIDNVSVSGSPAIGQPVNLSASASQGTENAQTVITITATVANPVSANETVTLQVAGTNISSGDYTLSSNSLVIANGQTSGSVTFTIVDDQVRENTETAIVSIANLSVGLASGTVSSVNIDIIDNDDALLLNTLGLAAATQTFDVLSNNGQNQDIFPYGTYLHEQGTGTAVNQLYRADNGGSTAGDAYSFGTTGSTDRAMGGLNSSSIDTLFWGVKIRNQTGSVMNALRVEYTGEMWRKGTAGIDSLYFEYSLNATSLTTGTWTPAPNLHFYSPFSANTATSVDGNNVAFQSQLLDTLINLGNLGNNAEIWIRWMDRDVIGNDDGLAVDNLILTPLFIACPAPAQQFVGIGINNVTGSTLDLNWPAFPTSQILIVGRNGGIVNESPQQNTAYTGNAQFGLGSTVGNPANGVFVVYSGPASVQNVTVTNLNPGDTYHFSAYAFDCNPPQYNLNNPPSASTIIPTIPSISVTPSTLANFTSQATFYSAAQQISVSGSFLSQDVQLFVSGAFELSLTAAGPYSPAINIPVPVSGTLAPTTVYVRYYPLVAGIDTETLQLSSAGVAPQFISLNGTATQAGSLPATFPLCTGPYQFNSWSDTNAAGTFPANMVFHTATGADPGPAANFNANYAGAYNLSSNSRINGLNNNGIEFRNTGTANVNGGFMGTALLGLNTINRNNIEVSWLAGTQFVGARDYRLTLEYRIGGGAWQSIPNSTYQHDTLGNTQNFGPITLPADCDNQTQVFLRWKYYQELGSPTGTRPGLRLNNILVNSQNLSGSPADVVLVAGQETDTLLSTLNGPVNTVTDGARLMEFLIRDGGNGAVSNGLPTGINTLTFVTGPAHNAGSLNNVFGAIALFNNNGAKLADGVVSSGHVSFQNLGIFIADADSAPFTIRATLATSGLLTEGTSIQLALDSIVTTGACSSTQFGSFSPVVSAAGMNMIGVDATEIHFFNLSPSIVATLPFNASVEATDAWGNRDNATRFIRLSTGNPANGVLGGNASAVAMNNGVATFTNLTYSLAETFQLVATDSLDLTLSTDTLLNVAVFCDTPTLPATSLTVTPVLGTGGLPEMNLSWTNGNGSNRIVIARANDPVTNTPVDGVAYTANNNYGSGTAIGSGFVVYNGNGNSVNITGLQPGTTYYFAVFEYDCVPERYLTVFPALGMATATASVINQSTLPFNVWPNPISSGEEIWVNLPGALQLFDISGRFVRAHEAGGFISSVGLPNGVYMLRHESGATRRVVIGR
jgi:hypothetical protein